METNTFNLELPASGSTESTTIESGHSLVIVGANGSGKTRLGTWIEFNSSQKRLVHRISAQKSLTMPEHTATTSLERAEAGLRFGYEDVQRVGGEDSSKTNQRWGRKPNTFLLNDYEKLMILLFTEAYEASSAYLEQSQQSEQRIAPPQTKLNIIKRIWERVLPHRELRIRAGKVETHLRGSADGYYNGAEMSDGERVVFYLIGQVLSAPQDGIIVIDEPELHLHKSIQTRLWHEVQAARLDCLFVYITHDVDFAASLTAAKKIWLESYNGSTWQWREVPDVKGLPEDLLLQVLGSRDDVLFVEGDEGSYDVALFRAIYPAHNVYPRSSCHEVIQATRGLLNSPELHYLRPRGIIDRDRRQEDEIAALRAHGIEVLDVAEVENLFCTPEVLRLVAQHLGHDPQTKLQEAEALVFKELENSLEAQISDRVAGEVAFRLNAFNTKVRGVDAIKKELSASVSGVDVDTIYREVESQFTDVLQNRDYLGALRIFNRKNLVKQIGAIFGLSEKGEHGLANLVLRMAQSETRELWLQALRAHAPTLGA